VDSNAQPSGAAHSPARATVANPHCAQTHPLQAESMGWRVAMYIYVPVALIFGVIFIQQGMPMTYASTEMATTLEPGSMGLEDKGQAKQQTIVAGPVAAVIPIKMLGTNGGGFYGELRLPLRTRLQRRISSPRSR
jgi:hypothetical protein